MKIIVGFFIVLGLISCGNEVKDAPKNNMEVISVSDTVQIEETALTAIDKPNNVVSPEFWENFDTNIEMAILFYKDDSLTQTERTTFSDLREEFPSLEFHEFYTDDKIAQVFINDTLAFDITSFLIQNESGLVLIKPFFQPVYKSLQLSIDELKKDFHEFYANK